MTIQTKAICHGEVSIKMETACVAGAHTLVCIPRLLGVHEIRFLSKWCQLCETPFACPNLRAEGTKLVLCLTAGALRKSSNGMSMEAMLHIFFGKLAMSRKFVCMMMVWDNVGGR